MNWLKKMIPLQLKSPVSVFFRELGKYPLDLVYKHALRTYVEEGGRVAGLQKEKIYRDVHKATLAYLDAQYGAMMECHTTDYVSGEKSREPVIWIFWWQGEECAPDIVKRCISSVRQNASGVKVCVIDSGNFGEYVSVPQHIMQKLEQGKISFTHFSDYYRMALLASHGGMWIDASLYAKGQLHREIFDLPVWSVRNPSGIFTNVSNWEWTVGAIAGWKGNTLFCTVEKLLNAYWKENDRVVDYFLLDYMMHLVVSRCAGLQKELAEIPANNPDFMYLQEHLTDPAEIYMDEFYGQDTVLYKISWKTVTRRLRLTGNRPCMPSGWQVMRCNGQDEVVMDKVSIVIPVYNVQQYLPECLDSVLGQSYRNWEAILVDDGSTDCSGSICDEYAQRDSRFVVVHQQNSGAACAKNTGLNLVSSGYVAFLDSDDYVDPNWLQTVVSAAVEHHADVVEFDFDKVYQTESERVNSFAEFTEFSAESYLDQYVRIWTSSLFWNKLFRSELVREVRFKSERRCIDDEFFTYKAVTGADHIVRISDVLYHYRQRASSAMYSPKNQHQIATDSLDVLVERYEWICTHFPKLRRTYLEHDVQILFYFAAFSHTEETVRKFRDISRYYLRQVIRNPAGISLLRTAVKLQFISSEELRREFQPTTDHKDIGAYFQ